MIASGVIESILRQARDAGIYNGPTNLSGDIVDLANRAVDRFLDQAPALLRKDEVGLFIAAAIQLHERGGRDRFTLQPPFPRGFARINWIVRYNSQYDTTVYIPSHWVEHVTRVITGLICRTVPRFYEVETEVNGKSTRYALQWKLDPAWGYIATFPTMHLIKERATLRVRIVGPTSGQDLIEPLGAVISDDWEIVRPEHIHLTEIFNEVNRDVRDEDEATAQMFTSQIATLVETAEEKEDSDQRVEALVDAVEKKDDK